MSWDNNSACKLINWAKKKGEFDNLTIMAVSRRSGTDEVSRVNIEIIEEVASALTLIIQAEVKYSMLELTQKVISEMSSFMKEARKHLLVGHGYVNALEGNKALKTPIKVVQML